MNVNKAFLKYYDANDLGKKNSSELAEIRAAFVAGYNNLFPLVQELRQVIESEDAPINFANPGEEPTTYLEDDAQEFYDRVVNVLYRKR